MILVALVFIFGSFMVSEKLNNKEVEYLSSLSKDEINKILDNSFSDADVKIQSRIDEKIQEASETSQRQMEKISNEKIMSIEEYANEVTESLHKTHTEVLFLYSMLNDKEDDLKKTVSDAQTLNSRLNNAAEHADTKARELEKIKNSAPKEAAPSEPASTVPKKDPVMPAEEELIPPFHNEAGKSPQALPKPPLPEKEDAPKPPVEKPLVKEGNAPAEFVRTSSSSHEEIYSRHLRGMSDIEIAKELGMGRGEVQLIIGLYEERSRR